MNIFTQYSGLRRENYVLFFGRMVTNMGSMVWPMMTLVLNQKLHMTATQSSILLLIAGGIVMPCSLIGGKLADGHNKKMSIVYFDLVSVFAYVMCAVVPLSFWTVIFMVLASLFQVMEQPVYNALIADITPTDKRNNAYSLQYLGGNIGLIVAPIIAGFLFNDFLWLCFLICGLAIFSSTVLIFFMVKDVSRAEDEEDYGDYQDDNEKDSILKVLWDNKIVLFYIVAIALYTGAYNQYSYLLPLDMGRIHGENGAIIYGSVSSINCFVVVICTPIFTRLLARVSDIKKTLLGFSLLTLGFFVFLMMLGFIPAYYAAMCIFTFGEVLTTTSLGPFLADRIPATHRGRINGVVRLAQGFMEGMSILMVGLLYDATGPVSAWIAVIGMVVVAILIVGYLVPKDKVKYGKLYKMLKKEPKQ